MVERLRREAVENAASAQEYAEGGFHGMCGQESGKKLAKTAIADELSKILAEENDGEWKK